MNWQLSFFDTLISRHIAKVSRKQFCATLVVTSEVVRSVHGTLSLDVGEDRLVSYA